MMLFYLKLTNACNLICDHCYIPQEHKNKSLIKDEVINSLISGINSLPAGEITIVWHGGEPLFYGVKTLREKTDYIVKNLSKEVRFSLQTNLIVKSREELDELIEYCNTFTEGLVSTSYDFLIRRYKGSFEEFEKRWFKNVNYLKERGLSIGVNITLTRIFPPEKIWNFIVSLHRDLGIERFRLNRFVPSGRGSTRRNELSLSSEEFYSCLTILLEKYLSFIEENGMSIKINPFFNMIRSFTAVCGGDIFSGNCLQNVLTVEPDGDVYICPALTDDETFHLGNITELSLSEILMSEKRISIISGQVKALCKCKYSPICNGGCPLFLMERNSRWCKRFFRIFVDRVAEKLFCFQFLSENSISQSDEEILLLKSFEHTCI